MSFDQSTHRQYWQFNKKHLAEQRNIYRAKSLGILQDSLTMLPELIKTFTEKEFKEYPSLGIFDKNLTKNQYGYLIPKLDLNTYTLKPLTRGEELHIINYYKSFMFTIQSYFNYLSRDARPYLLPSSVPYADTDTYIVDENDEDEEEVFLPHDFPCVSVKSKIRSKIAKLYYSSMRTNTSIPDSHLLVALHLYSRLYLHESPCVIDPKVAMVAVLFVGGKIDNNIIKCHTLCQFIGVHPDSVLAMESIIVDKCCFNLYVSLPFRPQRGLIHQFVSNMVETHPLLKPIPNADLNLALSTILRRAQALALTSTLSDVIFTHTHSQLALASLMLACVEYINVITMKHHSALLPYIPSYSTDSQCADVSVSRVKVRSLHLHDIALALINASTPSSLLTQVLNDSISSIDPNNSKDIQHQLQSSELTNANPRNDFYTSSFPLHNSYDTGLRFETVNDSNSSSADYGANKNQKLIKKNLTEINAFVQFKKAIIDANNNQILGENNNSLEKLENPEKSSENSENSVKSPQTTDPDPNLRIPFSSPLSTFSDGSTRYLSSLPLSYTYSSASTSTLASLSFPIPSPSVLPTALALYEYIWAFVGLDLHSTSHYQVLKNSNNSENNIIRNSLVKNPSNDTNTSDNSHNTNTTENASISPISSVKSETPLKPSKEDVMDDGMDLHDSISEEVETISPQSVSINQDRVSLSLDLSQSPAAMGLCAVVGELFLAHLQHVSIKYDFPLHDMSQVTLSSKIEKSTQSSEKEKILEITSTITKIPSMAVFISDRRKTGPRHSFIDCRLSHKCWIDTTSLFLKWVNSGCPKIESVEQHISVDNHDSEGGEGGEGGMGGNKRRKTDNNNNSNPIVTLDDNSNLNNISNATDMGIHNHLAMLKKSIEAAKADPNSIHTNSNVNPTETKKTTIKLRVTSKNTTSDSTLSTNDNTSVKPNTLPPPSHLLDEKDRAKLRTTPRIPNDKFVYDETLMEHNTCKSVYNEAGELIDREHGDGSDIKCNLMDQLNE